MKVIPFNPFAPMRRLGLAQATPMVWQAQTLKGSFAFQPGQRYAVLASVASSQSLAAITSYVKNKGFSVTFICEPPGGCTRNTYNIDTWLSGITSKPRSGERWVYAEGNFTGTAPWTISLASSFPVTLVVTYSIADVFLAVSAPATPAPVGPAVPPASPLLPPPPATPPGSTSSPWPYVAGGVAVVAGGAAWLLLRKKRR